MNAATIRYLGFPFLVLVLFGGCGTLPKGRGWGQDATLLPGLKKIGRAAAGAAKDPAVWIPAAGAVVFGLSDWDDTLQRWASEKRPLFGSPERAERASDHLRTAAGAGVLLTGLSAPSGPDRATWIFSKAKGLGVEFAAWKATGRASGLLKDAVGRKRPGQSNTESFPSQHASSAFSHATLGRRNTDALALPPGGRIALKTGFMTLAAGTGWARLERGVHYPSDVLAGAALGTFIAGFIHDAFMGLDMEDRLALGVQPAGESLLLRLDLAL